METLPKSPSLYFHPGVWVVITAKRWRLTPADYQWVLWDKRLVRKRSREQSRVIMRFPLWSSWPSPPCQLTPWHRQQSLILAPGGGGAWLSQATEGAHRQLHLKGNASHTSPRALGIHYNDSNTLSKTNDSPLSREPVPKHYGSSLQHFSLPNPWCIHRSVSSGLSVCLINHEFHNHPCHSVASTEHSRETLLE